MKVNQIQNRDIDPNPIVLSPRQLVALEQAIPFRRAPADREPFQPVAEERATPGSSGRVPVRRKRKWHQEHDAMRGDAAFDTDILMSEPLYKKSLDEASL